MIDPDEQATEAGATPADGAAEAGGAEAPGGMSAEDVFQHLSRIRSGISDGVITPW